MSGPEERRRAVDLYSATPMTTAQVVEHLGHPTRQCPERWLAKCVCSIESGPCERVESLQMSGRF
ncbi:IS3 family transposase [Bifidobacterium breve]|nr:IS3 family transposase [Bifidobacterium breve]